MKFSVEFEDVAFDHLSVEEAEEIAAGMLYEGNLDLRGDAKVKVRAIAAMQQTQ